MERDGEADAELGLERGTATRMLPQRWRYQTAYTNTPHPGFTFGDHFVAMPPPATDFEMMRSSDGEVDAAATAAKVWPSSFALARCASAHVAHATGQRPMRVLELGAGSGLPGLAAWAAGAVSVCLTDLPENLPVIFRCTFLAEMRGT